ncbi:prepilin peptidase [Streptomyces boninensis]|uniref:prepilin peptidase n=1 Tax=Streptomyces boninensis TaxID=2039455 RepID=UPI003B216819
MQVLIALLCAAYGAGVGLLLPRAAYRLGVEPGEAWRVECPGGHPLGAAGAGAGAVAGWIGPARCRDCAESYGPSPLPTTLAATLASGALGAVLGARAELIVWLLVLPVAALLCLVDLRVQRLPDVLTLPLAGGVLALLGVVALLGAGEGSWLGAVLGAAVLFAFFFVLFLINPRGMGFGDVKLALVCGAVLGWYGWGVLFVGTFAGFVLGAVVGLAMILMRRAGRKTALPFGPFMVAGAFAGVLVGAGLA